MPQDKNLKNICRACVVQLLKLPNTEEAYIFSNCIKWRGSQEFAIVSQKITPFPVRVRKKRKCPFLSQLLKLRLVRVRLPFPEKGILRTRNCRLNTWKTAPQNARQMIPKQRTNYLPRNQASLATATSLSSNFPE